MPCDHYLTPEDCTHANAVLNCWNMHVMILCVDFSCPARLSYLMHFTPFWFWWTETRRRRRWWKGTETSQFLWVMINDWWFSLCRSVFVWNVSPRLCSGAVWSPDVSESSAEAHRLVAAHQRLRRLLPIRAQPLHSLQTGLSFNTSII